MFYRLTKGLSDKGILVEEDQILSNITDYSKDWYVSVFSYSLEDKNTFTATGTVSGITNIKTDKLVFDFDSKDNIELAKKDALDLSYKLIKHGIDESQFNICFSGNKGFSIELRTLEKYTSKEIKNIAKNIAEEFSTWDSVIYNENRIFRVPYTKHPVTGLYKLPISLSDLASLSLEQLKELAKTNENGVEWKNVFIEIPKLFTKEPVVTKTQSGVIFETDTTNIKWLSKCKQQILNGNFKAGNRSNSLMALCASLKAQGLPKEITKRMLVGAAELQGVKTNSEPFSEEEIETNILKTVYSPTWKGATYSCKDTEFLQELCKDSSGKPCSYKQKNELVTIDTVSSSFEKYATDIDKNTIKTGIGVIDENLRLQTCSHVVVAGCSGSGKTTLTLNILNNISDAGSHAVFGSMDMGKNLIYQKLAHKVTGLNDKDLYEIYRSKQQDKIDRIKQDIYEMYKNVFFDFRSGVTIDELRENLLEAKERQGDSLKLVVLDFINRIRGPYSEETANLAYIAPRLSDLANETETLIISLAQTARHKGGPNTPLTDSRVSKGSSAIEESATAVLGIWRPGYLTDNDHYMCISALKTRMGKEFTCPLSFDGLTGTIRELSFDETLKYEHFLESLETKKKDKSDSWD